MKKVFVDTGPDFKSRESILKDLEKSKLDLEIVDGPEEAEILLGFGAGELTRRAVAASVGNTIDDPGTI